MALEQTLPPLEPTAPQPPPPEGRAPWGIADMAKAIGVVIVGTIMVMAPAAVIAVIIAGSADIAEDRTALAVALAANGAAELVLLLAVFMFAVRRYNVPWSAIGLRLPSRGWWLPLPLLVGAWIAVSAYFALVSALGVEPRGNVPSEAFETPALAAITGVLSLALAPFMEEVFFRGFLFGGLRRRWGFLLAALASGFLFALAHLDPIVYVPFTAVGVIFAWGYIYSRSLIPSMGAHLMFNSIAFGLGVSGALG